MPIEIVCPQCQAQLRVPDEAAGQQAKCPHCEEVFDVSQDEQPSAPASSPPPMPTSDPFADTTLPDAYAEDTPSPSDPHPYRDHAAEPNPYAAPQAELSPWPENAAEMQLGQLDAGTAVRIAWELLKANLPVLLLANGVVILVGILIGGLGGVIEDQGNPGLTMLVNLSSYAVQWFLGIGITLVNLHVARGKPADVGMVFAGGRWFVRVALATVIFSFMVLIGSVLFIIPGLYLATRFWAYQCFIVDRDCGVMESFSLSAQFMEGNKMQAFILMLLAVVIALVGVIAVCVGLFFAVPVITMMWVVAYLMVTRQPIQRPMKANP